LNLEGAVYEPRFMDSDDRTELVAWLETLHPIWEERHPPRRQTRDGQRERRLLRPVYWLGGWQFACLNYYNPPNYVEDRVVAAEPMPPVLSRLTARIEARARRSEEVLPVGWCLNTCLINFYGHVFREGRWVDAARVGGHRDHEPGPVGSLSLGARARFQFTTAPKGPVDRDVIAEQWLTDGSMLLFSTPRLKKELYHRVPNVSPAGEWTFSVPLPDIRVRRVNLTLRYVPPAHIVPFDQLGTQARADIHGYVATLAEHAPFWSEALSR
jgi:DNA oxidative demethylase